jgi:hypothetical protein
MIVARQVPDQLVHTYIDYACIMCALTNFPSNSQLGLATHPRLPCEFHHPSQVHSSVRYMLLKLFRSIPLARNRPSKMVIADIVPHTISVGHNCAEATYIHIWRAQLACAELPVTSPRECIILIDFWYRFSVS